MATSPEQIKALFDQRRKDRSPIIERMRDMQEIANGDVMVNLPEMQSGEKPAVANLIAEGIDQTSFRIASTLPDVQAPPKDPQGPRSRDYAKIRRDSVLAWWEANRLHRMQRRRARFLVAYGAAPAVVEPDFAKNMPRWRLRDPLTAFPAPSEFYDDELPADVIFAYRKTAGWVRDNFGREKAAPLVQKAHELDEATRWDTEVEILEYHDGEEIVLLAAARQRNWDHEGYLGHLARFDGSDRITELARTPNRAGRCTAVMPTRITLDRLQGQFNQLAGIYQSQATLMALELIAVEKSVFPDLALVPNRPGATPRLAHGDWKDGRDGEINVVLDGQVQPVNTQPGFKTTEAIDRLEQAQRMSGILPQWGGESGTNLRTGRASEVAMSAAVDFRIQEYQESLADTLQIESGLAIDVAKGYFGSQRKHFVLEGSEREVAYEPDKHFETNDVRVSYAMPGADLNNLVTALGQRVGLGTLSRKEMMKHDPLVLDPDAQDALITRERLHGALLASVEQQAAEGAIPPEDLARIVELVRDEGEDIAKAIHTVQREAQERQAEQHEEDAPELQPGLSPEGMGIEGQQMVQEPPDDLGNLQQLLFGLRRPETPAGGAPEPMVEGAG